MLLVVALVQTRQQLSSLPHQPPARQIIVFYKHQHLIHFIRFELINMFSLQRSTYVWQFYNQSTVSLKSHKHISTLKSRNSILTLNFTPQAIYQFPDTFFFSHLHLKTANFKILNTKESPKGTAFRDQKLELSRHRTLEKTNLALARTTIFKLHIFFITAH